MSRAELTYSFWKQREANLQSMFLNSKAEEIHPLEQKEIKGYLPDLHSKTILELGSGIGRYTGYFANVAKKVVSVDFIEQFVEKNKKTHEQYSNIEFICADAMEVAFSPNRFDFIFINWLFMYLADQEIIFLRDRIYEWLKPKGEFFFRESCALRTIGPSSHDPATYRSLHFYTHLFDQKFTLIKEGSMQVSIQTFANPFQCFWLFKK